MFNAEYPMVRLLERNGYDVSYSTGIDTDRRGAELLEHKTFLSVGHDEYWSGAQRANVEAARAAGVHLAFFSGNEVFWKTRWEPSIDGTGTPQPDARHLQGDARERQDRPAAATCGPARGATRASARPPTAAGRRTRSRARSSPSTPARPRSGCRRPTARCASGATRRSRRWRPARPRRCRTARSATNGTRTSTTGSARPGRSGSPPTTVTGADVLHRLRLDVRHRHGDAQPDAVHGSERRAACSAPAPSSGHGASTRTTTAAAPPPNARMQQATVNLFADMGAQPGTLQPGSPPPTPSADAAAPSSTITSPAANGTIVPAGRRSRSRGTATEAAAASSAASRSRPTAARPGSRATGRGTWTYTWARGERGRRSTLRSRAADDSGNVETPSAGVTVTVGSGNQSCPCTHLGAAAPRRQSRPRTTPRGRGRREVPRRRRRPRHRASGSTRARRNTGTHVGHLWTRTGTLLGHGHLHGESASGWQQVNFSTPVSITANTTYVASYHAPNGHYAVNEDYFATAGVDSPPLHALQDGVDGGNGVYGYGPSGTFPTGVYRTENYWVDVVFDTGSAAAARHDAADRLVDARPPPARPASGINANVTATFNEAMGAATHHHDDLPAHGDPAATVVAGDRDLRRATPPRRSTRAPRWRTRRPTPRPCAAAATGVKDSAGNALAADKTWTFTTPRRRRSSGCPCSIWAPSATPEKPAETGDNAALEVGVKFRAETDGPDRRGCASTRAPTNTGTHVGHLWTPHRHAARDRDVHQRDRLRLAAGDVRQAGGDHGRTRPTSSPTTRRAATTRSARTSSPRAPSTTRRCTRSRNGDDGGNGVYGYGPSGTFPTSVYRTENYWVDVVFDSSTAPTRRRRA